MLVIATVSILVATSGGGGGGTAEGADCENREVDDKGFTECMRVLAGAVVEHNECEKGAANPLGGPAIETPGATTASCTMDDDYTVMYSHFDKTGDSTQYIDTIKQQFESLGGSTGGSAPEEGDWNGDGQAGRYFSIDLGYGNGVLVFQVDDSPVAGVLMHISTDPSASSSGLTDFFEQHVKPGSDGGA
ncbi:hypothetical protein [Actinophytocola sp.]|uniref:hypothetical protein n=1 Tax=Actinophytocola sp. TaxID=1872138 RepID=UPI003D6C31A6